MEFTTFEYKTEISSIFTDIYERAKPSALCSFMQDAATLHAEMTGFSRDEMLANYGGIWMLSRLKYTLNKPLYICDKLTVKTWHRGNVGALWYRDFEFLQNDETIGHATTAWVMVNVEDKRLIRHSDVIKNPPKGEEGEILAKIPVNKSSEFWGDYKVSYSDIDLNCHLNNVKAADILSNAIELQNKENFYVEHLQINYLSESFDRDVLKIYADDNIIFASCDEKLRLSMKVKLKEIE